MHFLLFDELLLEGLEPQQVVLFLVGLRWSYLHCLESVTCLCLLSSSTIWPSQQASGHTLNLNLHGSLSAFAFQ